MPANHACTRCPFHKTSKTVCAWGEGNQSTGGLMLVGEALGAEEEQFGRPFVGSAGRELDSALLSVGKRRSDVYVSNISKCRPPGNRTPTTDEMSACFPYLAEEIMTLQPKIILCLGGAALKALTGRDSVGASRGQMVPPKPTVRVGDAKIMVTYHPASILHAESAQEKRRLIQVLKEDLAFAFKAISNHTAIDHKKALMPEGYTTAQLKRGLAALEPASVLACDLEWTGKAGRGERMMWPWTRDSQLFTISLTGKVGSTYLSLAFSWPPPDDEAFEALADFLKRKPTAYHNALSDLNWLAHVGLQIKLAGDSMLLAFLIDEEQKQGLEYLAPRYADVEITWKIPPRLRRPTTKEEWLELLSYNSMDTYATLKLLEALHKHVNTLPERERDGIWRIYKHILLPVVPTLVNAALNGIPMDDVEVASQLQASKDRTVEIVNKISAATGVVPRQAAKLAGSPQESLKFLRDAYGLNIESSNADELVGYDEYPIIKDIQAYRWERNKVQGTYFGPWDQLLREQQDHRLHSVYRLSFARTGRTSAEIEIGGSLQLAPREPYVRRTVRARDGWSILAPDYSQIELRMACWRSGDPVMLQFFKDDEDLHIMTAAFIKALGHGPLTIPEFMPNRAMWAQDVTKDDRQGAKGVNFGLVFGLQVEGLIAYSLKTYGVRLSVPEAERAHKGYFTLYERLLPWHDYCRNVVYNRGWDETFFGRFRRHFTEPNQAINFAVQSSASDLALFAMYHCDRELRRLKWPCNIIGFVHDSIMFECRDDFVKDASALLKHQMEHPDLRALGVPSIPVPLKADIAIGKTWADAH